MIVPLRALVTALVLVVVALAPAWPVDEVLMLTPAIAVQFAMDHQESIGMAHADALSAQAGVRESRADGLRRWGGRVQARGRWKQHRSPESTRGYYLQHQTHKPHSDTTDAQGAPE